MMSTPSTNSVLLREIRPDDMEEFLDLMELSFRDSLEEDRVNVAELRSIMKKMHNPFYKFVMRVMRVKSEIHVAELKDTIASGITFSIEKDIAFIGNIMTHPDFRRQGLARKLLQMVTQRALNFGAKQLKLNTTIDNTRAVSFYESEEFQWVYHSGKYVLNLPMTDFPQKQINGVIIREVGEIDSTNMDRMLDDCFASPYFDYNSRQQFISRYIPSRVASYLAKKVANQTIHTYAFFVEEEDAPCGYIQATQSRIEKRINLTAPIVSEQNNHLLLEAIPKVLELESQTNGLDSFVMRLSLHREDTIEKIQQIGFVKQRESLSMAKKLK